MEANVQALFYLILLFVCWFGLPLIPAWATYRITPDQKLGLTGPFAQLTLRATGAFAAYLVLLLVSYKLVVNGGLSLVGSIATPSVWTFKADVLAIDDDGKAISLPDSVKGLDVAFKPDLHQLGRNKLLIKLPQNPDNWPFLTITIPNFGGAEIDLNKMNGVNFDHFKKTVELEKPITIRRAIGGGLGIPLGEKG
ncbi:hypothetical protein [Variovorax sp. KK3]|nr:hypothetical protein [Variovorax sp. KK3]